MNLQMLPEPVRRQVESLQAEIISRFVAGLNGLAPDAAEQRIIAQAAQTLACGLIFSIGADAPALARWKRRTDDAYAELANLAVAHEIDAAALMRQTAHDAFVKLLNIATAVLAAP